jgi:hypothetical protein
MIPFKFKGYNVKIEGVITPSTDQVKFSFSNGVDDNIHILKLNTINDKKWVNVVNKIQRSINDRIRYLQQTNN